MGAEPYFYFVKYQPDINAALQELRRQEFQAGRYNPVVPFPSFPPGPKSATPGAQHASIEEAMEAAGASGTRSILDLDRVANEPDFGAVVPLADGVLMSLYGTARPTRDMVKGHLEFFEDIERGQGIYAILYKDDQPDEILFAGYSFD